MVDTDAICAAIKDVFQDTRSLLEPAGALAIAGAKRYAAQHKLKDKTLVAIAMWRQHELRPAALRGRAGRSGRSTARHCSAVTIPEQRGSFRDFMRDSSVTAQRHRVQLPHLRRSAAPMYLSASQISAGRTSAENIAATREQQASTPLDLTRQRDGQAHLRFMVGGRSSTGRTRNAVPLRVPRTAWRADEVS